MPVQIPEFPAGIALWAPVQQYWFFNAIKFMIIFIVDP